MKKDSSSDSPNQISPKQVSGCSIAVVIGLIILAGLVAWFFLWGRAIPAGEDQSSSSHPSPYHYTTTI